MHGLVAVEKGSWGAVILTQKLSETTTMLNTQQGQLTNWDSVGLSSLWKWHVLFVTVIATVSAVSRACNGMCCLSLWQPLCQPYHELAMACVVCHCDSHCVSRIMSLQQRTAPAIQMIWIRSSQDTWNCLLGYVSQTDYFFLLFIIVCI